VFARLQLADPAQHVGVQPSGMRERARCVEAGVGVERCPAVCRRIVDAPLPDLDDRESGDCRGPPDRRLRPGDPLARDAQRSGEGPTGGAVATSEEPVPGQRVRKPQRERRVGPGDGGVERSPHVGRLCVEPGQPFLLVRAAQPRCGTLGELGAGDRVAVPGGLFLTGLAEPLRGVRGNGLEQPVAGAAAAVDGQHQ
jgi:hypothetical protein